MSRKGYKALAGASMVFFASSPFANAAPKQWVLPQCVQGGEPVTLKIKTRINAGWQVNGVDIQYPLPNPWAWKQIEGAQWIAPPNGSDAPAGAYTYVVPFSSPGSHGAMTVNATWSADNCGVALQAGTGTPVGTGKCHMGDAQYWIKRKTSAAFSDADSANPNLTLTFVTSNQGGPTGLTGVFDITAQCP